MYRLQVLENIRYGAAPPPTSSTSLTPPSSSSGAPSASESTRKSKAPLIGGVVGGVVAALLLAALLLLLLCRRTRRRHATSEEPITPVDWLPDAMGTLQRRVEAGKVQGSGGGDAGRAVDDLAPTTGIVSPETKPELQCLSRLQSASEMIEDPPAYPASPPMSPSATDSRTFTLSPLSENTTDQPPTQQTPLEVVQRLLDNGVPSPEIATFIRLMGEQAGPSARPPGYDFKEE